MRVRIHSDFFPDPRVPENKYFDIVSVGTYARQDQFNEYEFYTVITFAHEEHGELEFAAIDTGSRFFLGITD